MRLITRPVVCAVVFLGFGGVAFEIARDLARGQVAASAHHPLWIVVHVLLSIALLSATAAAVRDEDHFDLLFSGKLKQAGPRGWLFAAFAVALEAVLLSCAGSFVLFCFRDGRPPLQWDRIGGALTDWVIDLALIFPLFFCAALFGAIALATVLGLRPREPGA